MKRIAFVLLMVLLFALSANAQSKLTVKITGIKNAEGKLYIALFGVNNKFLTADAADGKIIDITNNEMTVVFDNLKDGDYAVTMFQDENNNGTLDLGEYGIPTEKYGFSNGVDPAETKRAPNFEECRFSVAGNTTTEIELVHAIKE